jgi:Ni/Co efflux regulator RcnB
MKNTLFILVAIAFVAGTMLTSCNTTDKNAQTSQEKSRMHSKMWQMLIKLCKKPLINSKKSQKKK